ncbi:MAG TPA: hypothetical protein VFE58_10735 [Tepidisphaeraceae bacterium]|jgi:hypothetical protein|nr:hypothetical protein [Tepidisphaeraceae bacterium]
MATDPLSFRSIFLHAWDLSARGIDPLLEWAASANLNTLCLATTYHSGWFIHPAHPSHRAFMTEGSVCYFPPDLSLYKDTPLRPTPSRMFSDQNWLAKTGDRLDRHGLRLVSWTIGVHNTRLGRAYPEFTQRTVYGDSLPHALCISHDAVRAYLLALCRDLAINYPMYALQLEAFSWMTVAHGHHHERDLVGLNPFEQELLSLCFCSACTRRAAAANIDCIEVAATVRGVLDAVFREAPERPPGHPATMGELEERCAHLRAFNAWRHAYAGALLADIKSISLKGTSCQLLLETPPDVSLANTVDGFASFAYAQTPAQVAVTCLAAKKTLPADWSGLLQCLIRLGQGIPSSPSQLRDIITAVRSAGFNGINFYNHSESPPKMLSWIRDALA